MIPTVKKDTIIRTIVLALALINQILTSTGHSVIPVGEDQISVIITTGVAIWCWWKNNSFTRHARVADEYMEGLKLKEKLKGDENDG